MQKSVNNREEVFLTPEMAHELTETELEMVCGGTDFGNLRLDDLLNPGTLPNVYNSLEDQSS